jgi:hypothetical protein
MSRRPTHARQTPPSEPPSLWRQFWRAARGVKNFVLWEATFPTTKRSLAAFALWSQVGAPLAMLAFPSAEDVLRQDGLDPALVQQLGADHVRVLPATFGGSFLQASMLRPPGLALFNAFMHTSGPQEIRGAATQGLFGVQGKVLGFCSIVLPTMENYDVPGMVSALSGREIKAGEVRPDLPYSVRESYWSTALHEIRHCGQSLPAWSWSDNTMTESDADARSLAMLAGIFNNPQAPYVKMYARALHLDAGGHDTALYVDAALHGRPLPTTEEIQGAAKELDEYLDRWYLRRMGEERSWTTNTRTFAPRALKALLARGEESGLSPLALRRAQLYMDAHAYLTGGANAPAVPQP